jgi:nucleotide-binding universal stress UspA family protein
MLEFQRVLCPVDLSPFSRAALAYAVGMARWYRGHVTVLHITSPGLPPLSALAEAVTGFFEPPVSAADVVRRFADPVARAAGMTVEVVVREGDAAEQVLAFEQAVSPDLLVLGTHGLSPVEQRVLGSVADKILGGTRRPVLVVHEPASSLVPGHAIPFANVVVGVDFKAASTRALEHAYALAREGDARLVLVHAIEESRSEAANDEAEREARRRLHDMLPLDAAEWCLPQLVVTHGAAAEAVARVAAEWKADLIVVGAAGPHDDALGPSVPSLLRHAPCPVFVLPGNLRPSAARSPELTGAARG